MDSSVYVTIIVIIEEVIYMKREHGICWTGKKVGQNDISKVITLNYLRIKNVNENNPVFFSLLLLLSFNQDLLRMLQPDQEPAKCRIFLFLALTVLGLQVCPKMPYCFLKMCPGIQNKVLLCAQQVFLPTEPSVHAVVYCTQLFKSRGLYAIKLSLKGKE